MQYICIHTYRKLKKQIGEPHKIHDQNGDLTMKIYKNDELLPKADIISKDDHDDIFGMSNLRGKYVKTDKIQLVKKPPFQEKKSELANVE